MSSGLAETLKMQCMPGMATTMMGTGSEWNFPEVDAEWEEEALAPGPPGADTDPRPGALSTE